MFTRWAAGFFDGEGCITVYREKASSVTPNRMAISVTNTEVAPLHILQEMFGGGVYRNTMKHPRHRQQYIWKAYSLRARQALVRMYPHLVTTKKVQADVAISFQDRLNSGTRNTENECVIREAYSTVLQELKRC